MLFESAKALQQRYYTACDMDLGVPIKNGFNMCTMVQYNKELRQQHIKAVGGNKSIALVVDIPCCQRLN